MSRLKIRLRSLPSRSDVQDMQKDYNRGLGSDRRTAEVN
jgi:hypothetical protein